MGTSGSKVERLPNYWASKRNDDALVGSASYQPWNGAKLFGEWALYRWGPTRSSARMLDVGSRPILKDGHYWGVDLSHRLQPYLRVGTVVTRESLSRDDSLVKWLALQDLYRVSLGRRDRDTIIRLYMDVDGLSVAVYRNFDSTPFPWVSGITPIGGPHPYAHHSTDKWGFTMRVRLN